MATDYRRQSLIFNYRRVPSWIDGSKAGQILNAEFWGESAPPGGSSTGTLSATEAGSDTAAVSGAVLIQGAAAVTEAGSDTLAATGDVIIQGQLGATESGSDTLSIGGDVFVQGNASLTEAGADSFASSGNVTTPAATGDMAATEGGEDTFAAFGGAVSDPPRSKGWVEYAGRRNRTRSDWVEGREEIRAAVKQALSDDGDKANDLLAAVAPFIKEKKNKVEFDWSGIQADLQSVLDAVREYRASLERDAEEEAEEAEFLMMVA